MKLNISDEAMNLKANEAMLRSKGYILLTVSNEGALEMFESTESLNPAEELGLWTWAGKNVDMFFNDELPDDELDNSTPGEMMEDD